MIENCMFKYTSHFSSSFSSKVTNGEELDGLISDPDEMRMQALLIRERILGPQHPDTSYYIRYRGAVYADSGNFERCINLWKYALDMQQGNLDPLSPMTASSLLSFAELFSFMLQDRAKGLLGTSVSFEDLMGILSKSVLEIERAGRQNGQTPSDPAQLSKALSIILHLICLLEKVPCTTEQDHFKKETIYRCVPGCFIYFCNNCYSECFLFPSMFLFCSCFYV